MDIEDRIKESVLDQDHLADLLIGNEAHAEAIQLRVAELLESGLIELYTHRKNDGSILVLDKGSAVSIANQRKYWAWRSESGEEQLFFLSPVRLSGGALVYGF